MKKKRNLKEILAGLGVLLAAMIIAYSLIPLPGSLECADTYVSCRIVDRNGITLREVLSDRDGTSLWVDMPQISPHLIDATICAEDKRFFSHHGVDPIALARALVQNLKALRIVSGGSTITQQLAGIACNLPQGKLRSKFLEMLYALKIEGHYDKKRILEFYLNRIPYGNQLYGIEAASRMYFEMPSRDLSLAQSAFLASIPQAPTIYDPYRHFERTIERQKYILKLLYQSGKVDEPSYRQALDEPVTLSPLRDRFFAPHFCDLVKEKLDGEKIINVSLLRTTIDLHLQQEIEILLRERVRALEEKGVTNGAVVVMDNRGGEILAMCGSASYWGEEGQYNAALAKRQPGSTLKPFTYGLALENRFTASDIIPDLKTSIPTENGDFTPENYDNSFHGPVRLRQALACSYNIPAVRVLEQIGPELLYERLRLSGFSSLTRTPQFYGVGLTLGSGEVTLLELVRAYSIFARGGELHPDKTILQAEAPGGNQIEIGKPDSTTRVFSPQVSYIITDILSDREARVPAFGRFSVLNLPFPCAAKTGTSKGFRDNWTVGFTPGYTVGVWVGNFDGSPMVNVSGITGAAPLFRDIMRYLCEGKEKEGFERPAGIADAHVCPRSGALPGESCPHSMKELYVEGTEPRELCEVHRRIAVDVRTGMEATEECPPEFRRSRVFEIYAPLYAEWMHERGMRVPPVNSARRVSLAPPGNVSEPIVAFPKEGDEFTIDPLLRREYQVIHLKAVVPEGTGEVSWLIDGKCAGKSGYPYICEWAMKEGNHSAQVAIAGKQLSEKVQFYVH